MLPRRCPDSFKGPQKWSRQQYMICDLKATQKNNFILFCFTPPSIPGLHWNQCFLITGRLVLRRRCLDPFKGPGRDRGNNTYIIYYRNTTQQNLSSIFCCFTPPSIPGIHWNPCFFITGRLMLPRRCLGSVLGPQKWSQQKYIIYFIKTIQKMKFNICLLYPGVSSGIILKSMFLCHKTSNAAAPQK